METPSASLNRLEISRVFKATPEAVFDAWTQPEAIAQWMGCSQSTVKLAEIDLKAGGKYKFVVNHPEMGDLTIHGVYQVVDKPNQIAFTWNWLNGPLADIGETNVKVEFIAQGDSTEMRLTHEGFINEEVSSQHDGGWSDSLEKLTAYINK